MGMVISSYWALAGSTATLLLYVLVLLYILYAKSDDPAEAAFWLLVVALIPVGGLLLFLFFGITRLGRVDGKVRTVCSRVEDAKDHGPGLALAAQERSLGDCVPVSGIAGSDHNRMLDRLFPQSLLLGGNRLEMLRDGNSVYPRMLEDIAAARHCIRLQSFIFMSDEVGMKILNALERKAAEGVDVKILFDSFGSCKSYFSPFFRRCLFGRREHFQIRAFSPINLLTPWKFQLRNHRKLLVIDGRIAYSGGINISRENEHLQRVPASRYIHDLHCRITGPAVSQFTLSFFRDWMYTTGKVFNDCALPEDFPAVAKTGRSVVRVLESGPGNNYQGTKMLFFAAASLARRSLTIVTPYLVPGPAYINALCMAAARGVAVKIVVPKHNNHIFVDFAARSLYHRLLRHGVRIFEKRGCFSHIKALMVDSEWGFMGSSNCDSRSFRLNFELDFCFERGRFLTSMLDQVRAELAESDEVQLFDVEAKSIPRRLCENACALLTPIL